MSPYGVGGATQGVVVPRQEPARRAELERRPPAAAPAASQPPAGSAPLPEPPSGTDPELWSVLTTEERALYARVGGMGPLTYSHMIHSGQPATAVVRGGRIDVRV